MCTEVPQREFNVVINLHTSAGYEVLFALSATANGVA